MADFEHVTGKISARGENIHLRLLADVAGEENGALAVGDPENDRIVVRIILSPHEMARSRIEHSGDDAIAEINLLAPYCSAIRDSSFFNGAEGFLIGLRAVRDPGVEYHADSKIPDNGNQSLHMVFMRVSEHQQINLIHRFPAKERLDDSRADDVGLRVIRSPAAVNENRAPGWRPEEDAVALADVEEDGGKGFRFAT